MRLWNQFSPRARADDAEDASLQQIPPKICFNLLKERDARKKLQDLGLSTSGEKYVRPHGFLLIRAF